MRFREFRTLATFFRRANSTQLVPYTSLRELLIHVPCTASCSTTNGSDRCPIAIVGHPIDAAMTRPRIATHDSVDERVNYR